MDYIDDEILDNIMDNMKLNLFFLNEKEQKKYLIAIVSCIMIPISIATILYGFKKILLGTIFVLLCLCINIILIINLRNLTKKRSKSLLTSNDIDKKINIIDMIDSNLLEQLYKENAITFKAIPSIKVLSFIYNILHIKSEKLDIYTFFGKDLKKKFDCKEIDDELPFICISSKDINYSYDYLSILIHLNVYQYFNKLGDFIDKHVETYDWDEIPYYTEASKLQKYFSDFFDESNKIKNCRPIPAFEILEILAEHQWHTYKLLDKDLLDKVDKFIADNIDVESEIIMINILNIIVHLGLGNRFKEITQNIDKISNPKVIELIKSCDKKYGDNIDNPYYNLINGKWRYKLEGTDDCCIGYDSVEIHTVERNGKDLLIYIDALYNPMYDKIEPKNEPLYIGDCMILLKNVEVVSEKAGGFTTTKKDVSYISFEEFCKKGCEDVQRVNYDKIKKRLDIQGYQANSLVDLLFKCDSINLYWNIYNIK